MKRLLAPAHRDVLGELAEHATLYAFDFDGTLAPTVRVASRAALPSRTKRLLARLAAHGPCAVISGRSHRDISARLEGIGLVAVLGCHGLDDGRTRWTRWRASLRCLDALRGWTGLDVEDKGACITVHLGRHAADQRARRELRETLARAPGVTLVDGATSVDIVPAGSRLKGHAFRRLMRRFRCSRGLYVGNDASDEDVFELSGVGLVGVRVGRKASSHAEYYVQDRREVDSVLHTLVTLTVDAAARRHTVRMGAPPR